MVWQVLKGRKPFSLYSMFNDKKSYDRQVVQTPQNRFSVLRESPVGRLTSSHGVWISMLLVSASENKFRNPSLCRQGFGSDNAARVTAKELQKGILYIPKFRKNMTYLLLGQYGENEDPNHENESPYAIHYTN